MPNSRSHPSSPSSVGDYEIVPLRAEHAQAMAVSHSVCFPGYFLTSLGLPYVGLFYRALALSSLGVAVVAVGIDGKILCFAAGATKSDDFRRYFFRHHFFRSAWALLVGFCCDRHVRYYLIKQSYRLKNVFRLLLPKRHGVSDSKAANTNRKIIGDNVNAYSLMSMGTVPECRGSRLASEIITAFESAVLQRGGNAVKVSTGKDNQRAIGFYQKNGYEVYRDTRPGDVDLIKLLKI